MPQSSILTPAAKKEALQKLRQSLKEARYDRNLFERFLRNSNRDYTKAVAKLSRLLSKYDELKGTEVMPYKPTGKPVGRPKMTDEQKAAAKAARKAKADSAFAQPHHGHSKVPADLTPLIPTPAPTPFKAEDGATGDTVFNTVADATA